MVENDRYFPLVKVSGSNFEMGVQHGEQCSDMINEQVKIIYNRLEKSEVNKTKAKNYAKRRIEHSLTYSPHLIHELNGIAEGSGLEKEEIYLMNTGFPGGIDECTTFVVYGEKTYDGNKIFLQNIDNSTSMRSVERGIVVHQKPEEGHSLLYFCRAGELYPHGINSGGGIKIANAIRSTLDRQFGTPGNFIGRMLLEQATIKDSINILEKADRAGSLGNFMCEPSGRVAYVEWCPNDLKIIESFPNLPNRGYMCHTNHFLHPDMLKYEGKYGINAINTNARYERILELFKEWEVSEEKFYIDKAKMFASDHKNKPDSICRHTSPSRANPDNMVRTIGCVIAQPEKGTLYICKGNPCEGKFRKHSI
jgi:isopenicillin-N N-acyltransferase-like protein